MSESLIVIMEKTKVKINMSVNQAIRDSGLPAYLMEGILMGILADIKEQKNIEILQAMVPQEDSKKGTDQAGLTEKRGEEE